MGVKLVLEYVLGQGILERKKDFQSLETGTPILYCFFFFLILMRAVICNTYFVVLSAKWLQRWVCPGGKVTS